MSKSAEVPALATCPLVRLGRFTVMETVHTLRTETQFTSIVANLAKLNISIDDPFVWTSSLYTFFHEGPRPVTNLLTEAVSSGNASFTLWLLNQGIKPSIYNTKGIAEPSHLLYKLLRVAGRRRTSLAALIQTYKFLLSKYNFDFQALDAPYGNKKTLLHTVCEISTTRERELEALMQFLIEAGVNINQQDSGGNTSLHIAVNTSLSATRTLLKFSPELNIFNNSGQTPLLKACQLGSDLIVPILLEAGADVNAKHKKSGATPLSIAIGKRNWEMFNCCMKAGANSAQAFEGPESPLKEMFRKTHKNTPYGATCAFLDLIAALPVEMLSVMCFAKDTKTSTLAKKMLVLKQRFTEHDAAKATKEDVDGLATT